MAIDLSVVHSGANLLVYAGNQDDHVAIVDHIILTVEGDGWTWHTWHYEDDFYLGTNRVSPGWTGLFVMMNYSGGAASAHATADYWNVDQRVKSSVVNIP